MTYTLGIDIGGTKLAGAVITPSGVLLHRIKIPTPRRVEAKTIYAVITDMINQLLSYEQIDRRHCQGIGMGVPGIVDTRNLKILAAPNIDLTGFPLAASLTKRFKLPIAMANDVNAGLVGEAWLGAAKGFDHVVGIFPGTGVGGAVIADGRLLLGSQGAATELGHMMVDLQGPKCHCGQQGCLEALTGRWAIERDIRLAIKNGRRSLIKQLNDGRLDQIKSRVFKEALQAKDPLTKEVFALMSRRLGRALVSLNHIFNPQIFILGGGVVKACGPWILPLVQKEIDQDPFFSSFSKPKVMVSLLGDDAVLFGAAHLVHKKKSKMLS